MMMMMMMMMTTMMTIIIIIIIICLTANGCRPAVVVIMHVHKYKRIPFCEVIN